MAIDCEALLRHLQADSMAPVKPLALGVRESDGALHMECRLPHGAHAGLATAWLDCAVHGFLCSRERIPLQRCLVSGDLFGSRIALSWKIEEYPEPDVVVKG